MLCFFFIIIFYYLINFNQCNIIIIIIKKISFSFNLVFFTFEFVLTLKAIF